MVAFSRMIAGLTSHILSRAFLFLAATGLLLSCGPGINTPPVYVAPGTTPVPLTTIPLAFEHSRRNSS